jgi:hypothetical protein
MSEVYAPISLPDLFLPASFGLSSVVNWITPSDTHWAGGVQYDVDCTEVSVTLMTCISGVPSDPAPTKSVTWSHATRGARAFTVFDRADCSPVGSDWYEVGQQKVLKALTQSGPIQLERTFWSGVSGAAPALVYPNLTSTGPIFDDTGRILLQPSSTLVSGAPLDVVEGLGQLENTAAACYDGELTIHVPLRIAAELEAKALIYRDGSIIRTYCGSKVAIGRGYVSTIGPGASTPPVGSTWMFATGPIFGIRGTPRTFSPVESFDRSVNTVQMIAEQTFLLGWQCCLTGVLVTTGGEQAGDPLSPLQDT